VLTIDGRTLQGELLGIDNQTNLLLNNTIERKIYPADDDDHSNDVDSKGVYLVRGDIVLLCGLVDEEMDNEIDWMKVKGGPIGSTKHT
jgi:U6 snRNA-associated Sm-like protein LSm8